LFEYKIIDRLNNSGKLITKTLAGNIKNEISLLNGRVTKNKNSNNVKMLSSVVNSVSTEDPYIDLPEITIISYLYTDQATNW
jgi:hypothetical protein